MPQNISKLHKAKANKNNEFYTRYEDVEKELNKHKAEFKDKVVYCPCDNWKYSAFVKYFKDNFKSLGLKKLIASNYSESGTADYYSLSLSLSELKEEIQPLSGNGDFRSIECLKFFEEADIVVTNPPFSLFREFVDVLEHLDLQFCIIAPKHSVQYKNIFYKIKAEKYKTTTWGNLKFSNNLVVGCLWLTTFNIDYPNPMELTKTYNPLDYPKYANFDAIEVSKTKDIPKDYDGVMGVPISFLSKWNPSQFYVIGCSKYDSDIKGVEVIMGGTFIIRSYY